MSQILTAIDTKNEKQEVPDFRAGDTVSVNVRVREGNKERIQQFQGVVIQRRGTGVTETFTVRKMSGTTSVERVFPLHTPLIASIDVERKGAVRQARIFYMRDLQGKAARIKERK